MKGLVIIFGLLAYAQSQAVIPGAMLSCGSIPHGAMVADMNSCSRYMICSNGNLFGFTCQQGSNFNPATSTCQQNYLCWTTRDTASGISTSTICNNYATGTYLASSTGCRDFYYCSFGQAYLSTCPVGYAFSSFQSSCAPSTLACANVGA